MKTNDIFNERVRFPLPTRELERRWQAVRQAMKADGIDLLIMQNDNQWMGGYVRYFTDIPAEQAYPVSVLFPVDDEIITITSAAPDNPAPPDWACRGVGARLGAPYFRTVGCTDNYDAIEMAKVIKKRGDKKVGFVGMGLINTAISTYLKENCQGVEFVNAADLVDLIKAVKSEDELVFIREAIKMHDVVAAAMPALIRPGVYEYELRAELQRILVNMGSEEQWIMMGSAPSGTRTPHLFTFYQNRRIEKGDNVMVMVECSGPGGYYAEVARTWCLGEPTKELMDTWDFSCKVQHYAASLLKPGVRGCDVINKVNEFLVSHGYPKEGRLFGHGQGYDLVERPAFLPDEMMELSLNMMVAIHPPIVTDTALGFACDNYLITETGAELMETTPQKLILL